MVGLVTINSFVNTIDQKQPISTAAIVYLKNGTEKTETVIF